LHLAFLGLELYFKAGIAAAGREYPKHHDLATLQTLYSELWPAVHLPIRPNPNSRVTRCHLRECKNGCCAYNFLDYTIVPRIQLLQKNLVAGVGCVSHSRKPLL
jgi:hypothetical protein